MLSIAGSTLPDERISSALIMLIQRNPELHAYVVHKLFWALHDDASQLSLVHVGLWCIGEYSQLLLLDAPASEETLSSKARVDESTVVQLLKTILRHHVATDTTRAYALTAMAKLTTRFRSPAEVQALNSMTKAFSSSMVLELQQRATEYAMLGQPQWSSLRPDVFAVMPAMDASKIRNRHGDNASMLSTSADLLGDDSGSSDSAAAASSSSSVPLPVKPQQQASLLDLDDIFGGSVASSNSSAAPFGASTGSTTAPPAAAVDLLADIFSTGPSPAAPVAAPTTASNASDLLGLLDFGAPAAALAPVTPAFPPVRAYEKNGLTVDLEITKPNKDDPSVTFITATTRNGSAVPVDKFVFLAAFPKYIKLKMEPPSGDALPANNAGAITQVVKIQNTMQGEVRDAACPIGDVVCQRVWSTLTLACAVDAETRHDAHQARVPGERRQDRRHGGGQQLPGQRVGRTKAVKGRRRSRRRRRQPQAWTRPVCECVLSRLARLLGLFMPVDTLDGGVCDALPLECQRRRLFHVTAVCTARWLALASHSLFTCCPAASSCAAASRACARGRSRS